MVKCQICGKEFKSITNTHLAEHNITQKEYKEKFPDAKTSWNQGLTKETSEEVKEVAESVKKSYTPELRLKRKLDALRQMQDPEQRKIRSKLLTGRKLSKKTIKKISWSKLKNERNIAKRTLIDKYGETCQVCGKHSNRICLHHIDGRTWVNDLDNLMLLCPSCHATLHNKTGLSLRIENFIAETLQCYNIDLKDPNWIDTPIRFAKVLHQFLKGYTEGELNEIFSRAFPSQLNDMVIVEDIPAYGLCPHHLLPVLMKVFIGYIPRGKVLGVSKFRRIAQLLAQKPSLQEDLTENMADIIYQKLKPDGVIVVIKAMHLCMVIRGVNQPNMRVTTSAVRGIFEEHDVKKEFLELISL